MRQQHIKHEFVEFVPERIEPGKLYVSIEYNSASHLCACGCGNEVVTILGPADSSITYDGRSVSISTSIGNSNFPCKSHYWIKNNRIVWESRMTPRLTALSRARDRAAKAREYSDANSAEEAVTAPSGSQGPPSLSVSPPESQGSRTIWRKLFGR